MGACRRPEGPFTCWPSYNSMDASMGTPPSPPSLVRQLPSAEKFSSAKPIGSKSLWQLAQGSFLRCNVCFSRTVKIFPGSPVVSSSGGTFGGGSGGGVPDRKSTRLNSSHLVISYAVFCLKKKTDTPRYTDVCRPVVAA